VTFDVAPISLGVTTAGYLQASASDRFVESHPLPPPDLRATPTVVLTPEATPFIVYGRPVMPAYPVIAPVSVAAVVGPNDIRVVSNPDPVWDAVNGVWVMPPPTSGVGDYRWTVQSRPPGSGPEWIGLPNPVDYDAGYYPLGNRTTSDGTADPTPIEDGATASHADPSTGGPSWQSAYPFKPNVVIRQGVTSAGNPFVHPAAVSFSASTAQHMWLDMGADVPQPFSWVIACMPTSQADQLHTILDAGMNPFLVGFPVLSETQLGDDWAVADNLAYRTTLSIAGPGTIVMNTATSASGGYGVTYDKPKSFNVVPRLYGMVYNGANSMLYVRGADINQVVYGKVAGGSAYKHRYYVLGRRYGIVGPDTGCEMFALEIRFWKRALTASEMDDQYGQLSSTYLFDSYAPQRGT
jgi:hypothetical protein